MSVGMWWQWFSLLLERCDYDCENKMKVTKTQCKLMAKAQVVVILNIIVAKCQHQWYCRTWNS